VVYDFEEQANKVIAEAARGRVRLFYLVGWSPDSRKIAFVSEVNDQIDLFVMDIETLVVRPLTNTSDIETLAVWSTTEDQLLFGTINDYEHALQVSPYGAQTLYLVDGSGANLTMLGGSYYVFFAAWSPNGEKIAYSNYAQICILDMTSLSEVCPLEDTPPYNGYFAIGGPPSWSADGNWLAFQATGHEEGQCYRVYILELNTNRVTPVDLGTCGVDPFYWSRAVP
jgi:Tol biopolymer transport system component